MAEFGKRVLVIGGGTAGLSAAEALHQRGLEVHLIERERHLGGKARDWSCMATDVCQHCGACLTASLVKQVTSLEHVNVYRETRLAGIEKAGGGFKAVLEGGHNLTLNADAVVTASGFTPYDPSALTSLGYGTFEQVVTTADLNRLFRNGKLEGLLPQGGPPRIAFIQCVGSRNRSLGRNYCSQVCCKITVRHAQKFLHLYPDADISVFHIDLQVIGKAFRSLCASLAERIALRQGVPAEIRRSPNGDKMVIVHEDEGTGSRISEAFDLVVLSVGLGPDEQTGQIAQDLGLKRDAWGFFKRPDDGQSDGVYVAGTAAGPMAIVDAVQEGRLAAGRVARDLLGTSVAQTFPAVGVIGGGPEALAVADGLSRGGFEVKLFNTEKSEQHQLDVPFTVIPATPVSIEGVVGDFLMRFETPKGLQKEKIGAFVVANGAEREPVGMDDAGGHLISLAVFETMDAESMGEKIVFLLDYSGPEWKENAARVLEAAHKLALGQKSVYVLMEKMLVHGIGGQEAYDAARKAGVRFLRAADPAAVSVSSGNGAVTVSFEDTTLPGTHLSLHCDHLVIPGRVVPSGANADIAAVLRQELDVEGFGQSPNVRHRPVGSPRKGVFYAGSCHDEIDPEDLEKEIQTIAADLHTLFGTLTSGREQAALIDERLCARCLTCFRSCQHQAIVLQETGKPRIVPEACLACGLCVASCPAKAIGQPQWQDADLTAEAGKAATLVFACERSAMLAAEEARRMGLVHDESITVQPVKCAGRVSIETMLTSMLNGAQRVVVAGCYHGNCRSMDNSRLAAKRADYAQKQAQAFEKNIGFYPVAANEPEKFRRIASGEA